MKVGSLFSGIGGLELGLERAGMTVKWQVENDPYCLKVLAKHWPDIRRYTDIKKINWLEIEPVDLICGGFPCQPVSSAGQRKVQEDERWLWPYFFNAIRTLQPRYALIENVAGLLIRGFADVLCDLSKIGYNAEWESLPASAFGAPHIRDRVYIVAYPSGAGSRVGMPSPTISWKKPRMGFDGRHNSLAHANSLRQKRATQEYGLHKRESGRSDKIRAGVKGCSYVESECNCRDQPWACCRAHEDQRLTRCKIRRISDGVSNRVDRIRCLGNAVVPQVAEWIGRQIIEFDRSKNI